MKDVTEKFNTDGYIVVRGALDDEYISLAKTELKNAILHEVEYHGTTNYKDYGMVLNCALYGKVFWDIFDRNNLIDPINQILGEGCIVYAFTSSSMPPNQVNYSGRIHVDCPRIIPGYITNLGVTVMLDDFTIENGATHFLPGSHSMHSQPDDSFFEQNSQRLIGKAGDAWIFNARVWHKGGVNKTNEWRHALTINLCRPWMKQRIDIPRSLKDQDLSEMSEKARQKLGFLAQVPENYEEYYAPTERRKYQQKTE